MGARQSTETMSDPQSSPQKASHKRGQIDRAKALAERAARSFVEPIDLNDPAAHGYGYVEYVDHKDRERHERIWYDSEGNERHDPKPKKPKRTARLSTGGKAPRKLLATRASRST